jgi:hypothetical protein
MRAVGVLADAVAAHRHAGHAFNTGGDDDVIGAGHHALGGKMHRLLG